VCEVAYEPSRDLLAVWLVSGSVRLYSLGSGKLEATIPASKREGSCRVGLAPGAGLLAAGNQPQATLYRLDTRRPVGTLVWHKGTVGVLAFGKGEQVLATGADNGELMLWKVEEEEEETPVVVRPPVPTKPEEKPGGGAPSGEAPHDWLPKDDVVVGESMVMEGLQFDQSSYILRPEGKAELDKVAAWMKKYPRLRISLEGHTSNEGDPARNLTLSRQRVESAKNYLLDRGLGEDRIETQAYGETRPVADNKTAAGRAKNRRIELRVLDF
jgi:outer membrane protein OmpA-like peptidoglycan-associated protein